jgi:formamidopyrimidine-DNA glycosylase
MPELPEVQALVDFLTERAVGKVVARVDVATINVLKTFDPPVHSLQGLEVTGASRHGKFLDLDVSGLHLVIHLARAGWLHWRDALPPVPPKPGKGPIALRVHLDDKSGFDLTEAGTQKKLAAYVVRSPQDVPGIARLGPEPLDPAFTIDAFRTLIGSDRSQIKGLLRDQSKIAGIGNAYSDDILHAAKLSPFKSAANLDDAEVQRLYDAIESVLSDAVERARGHAAGELKAEKKLGMRVHGRSGQPCPVCGDTVRSVSFADSSLDYCPTCQTGGKPLADRRLSRLLK